VVCNPPLAQIGELGACAALVRLDLSGNQLTSLAGLEALQQLKWLSASGNALRDTVALRALSNLRVSPTAL
jgi:Leucine-rich repeat (LRR) protein